MFTSRPRAIRSRPPPSAVTWTTWPTSSCSAGPTGRGAQHCQQICRLTEVAGVLTDHGADQAAVQSLTDSGVEVLVA